jgi:hypothetical protein
MWFVEFQRFFPDVGHVADTNIFLQFLNHPRHRGHTQGRRGVDGLL